MRIIKFVFITFLLFYLGFAGFTQKTLNPALNELIMPRNIVVSKNRLYVTDYPFIYIYSLPECKLVKKIGGQGKGPGEFYLDRADINDKHRGLGLVVDADRMIVDDLHRITFFSPEGDLQHTAHKQGYGGGEGFWLLGENYVRLTGRINPKKEWLEVVTLIQKNMKNYQIIHSTKHWHPGPSKFKKEGYNFFKRSVDSLIVRVSKERIFVYEGGHVDFLIHVYDNTGKKIKIIKGPVELIKINREYICRVHNYYKIKFKRGLESNIKATKFGEFFPAVRDFRVDNQKIYVFTFKRAGNKNQLLIIDFNGNLISQKMVFLQERDPEYLFPFTITNGKLYQLVEEEETQEWTLQTIYLNKSG